MSRLDRLRKNSNLRHSERSEESLFDSSIRKETRRDSSLRSECQNKAFFPQPVKPRPTKMAPELALFRIEDCRNENPEHEFHSCRVACRICPRSCHSGVVSKCRHNSCERQ